MLISKSPSVVVKPSSEPVTGGHISLTSYDMPNVGRPVTAFLVFEHPIDDPAETIKRGMSLALVHYYPISGRLAAGAADLFTAIDCSGETGVPFVTASADAALKDVNLDHHLDELALFFPVAGDPLLMVQVTVFSCGGFVVGLTCDHSVADGAGMGQFLQAVGELARGMPSPAVVPVRHDPALAAMPLAFRRFARLVYSLQPAPMAQLHLPMPYSLVTRIQHEFSTANKGGQPCTALDAITAVLWRCRTRAVMQEDPSAPALLFVVADTRRHAGAKVGYYGNCYVMAPPVVATNGAVADGDIIDVIRMIRRAKDQIAVHYSCSRDNDDEDERRLQELAEAGTLGYDNMLVMTCWRHLGLDKPDFGGGTPARVMGYRKDGMVIPPFCVCLPCKDDGESFSVTSLCVREEHAGAFLRELANFT